MKNYIITRIELLGGKINIKGKSLEEDIKSILFDKMLILDIKKLPFVDFLKDEIYKNLKNENSVIPDYSEIADIEVKPVAFKPVTPQSNDFDEWHGLFDDEYLKHLCETMGIGEKVIPEFMILAYSRGFPDCYFINLHDRNIENPMVYTTDLIR